MSKADSDSIRKPTPVTVTVAEITSLCDRLAARAKSVLLADQPEQVRDLDLAARAFQQVQKYENGTDRVSASRLYLIAEAFGVGIGFFYGLDDAAAGIDTAAVAGSIGLLGERYAIEVSNASAT